MAKIKKAYFCRNCGFEAPKWLGKCPGCGEWNTFTEEIISRGSSQVPSADRCPKAGPSAWPTSAKANTAGSTWATRR